MLPYDSTAPGISNAEISSYPFCLFARFHLLKTSAMEAAYKSENSRMVKSSWNIFERIKETNEYM